MLAVTGKYGTPRTLARPRDAEEDGHRLLGADHGDGYHRDARPHGDLDEAAATEAPEAVAVGVGLGRALGPLGEDEDELSLVAQDPAGVVGMSGDTADPGPHGADPRRLAEEVVGQAVDGPAELLFDAVHDHGGVGGDGAGVVGHQQGPTGLRDLLEALPLDPEPVLVERGVELAGQAPHVLGAAPLVDVGQAVADDRLVVGSGQGDEGGTLLALAVSLPVAIGVIVPGRPRGHDGRPSGSPAEPAASPGEPLRVVRRPRGRSTRSGSNSTTVPVWAAWMMVSAP